MRVGIVTQPLEMNYGGLLQNWALQQVLKGLGHDPVTIDAYERYSTPHYLYNCLRAVVDALRHHSKVRLPKRYHGSLRRRVTGEFIEHHIATTRVMWDYKRSVVRRYRLEGIVVGSDQVWRAKYNGAHIEDMYLEFVEGLPLRRVAYAASFGVDEWEYTPEQTAECGRLARQMDAVSVREASGIALCRDNLGVEACCVLDPTLLCVARDYEALIGDEGIGNGDDKPYLAVYCLDITPVKRAFFEQLAAERGLEVRYFSAGHFAEVTVPQWLLMFKQAAMVVTDSFHGTVFSILFGKEFYTLANPKRGNTRISGLLGQLGLERHMVSDVEPVEPADAAIDWQDVTSRLDEQRRVSLDFLAQSLREQ